MRRHEVLELELDLFREFRLAACSSDEAEERRGRIKGSGTKLGMGLQSDEERVVCSITANKIMRHKLDKIRAIAKRGVRHIIS